MLKDSAEKLSGNERFEGFGIELIHELSLMLGFNYTFHLQADGAYGSKDADGNWNGMIREIRDYVRERGPSLVLNNEILFYGTASRFSYNRFNYHV